MTTELFDGYTLDGFHDEAFTAARGAGLHPRPDYEPLLARLEKLTPAELAHRERLRAMAFRSQGITFTVYDEDESADGGLERTFLMDLVTRIIVGERHVKIGHGRDYDVPPFKGVFSGPPEHDLDVRVEMRRMSDQHAQQQQQ